MIYPNIPQTGLEAFEYLPEGTNCQLVNDHIIMFPSLSIYHQEILGELLYQLRPLRVLGTVLMRVDTYLDDKNIFLPDLMFIANSNKHIIKEHIYGAPDIIIEILSPESASLDENDKKDVYLKYGVKELWLVDPKTKKCKGHVNGEIIESTGQIKFSVVEHTVSF